MIGVLFLKSGAPHQSQAPSSEFRGDRSSDFKISRAPSVPGSIFEVQRSQRSSDFKIIGAPSVLGFVLSVQELI